MSIPRWASRAIDRLAEPHPDIAGFGDRLTARLFAILMLVHVGVVAVVLPAVDIAWRHTVGRTIWRDMDVWLVMAATVAILGTYAMVKIGWYRAGAIAYIALAALVPLVAPFVREPQTEIGLLATAVLPVLLAAIAFSFKWVLAVLSLIVVVASAQLLRAGLGPGRTETGFALVAVVAVVGGLVIVFRHHLGQLENWRLGQLRESERKYRQLFETVSDALLLADGRGRLVEANRSACRQLGYTREQLVGQPFDGLLAEPGGETADRLAAVPIGGHAVFEAALRRRDGSSLPVELAVTRAEFGGDRAFLAVARDISARQRAAEEKQRLADQLQQAARMESIGQLAGGVAHDFNNLLAVIIGHAGLAAEEVPERSPTAEALLQIRQAGETAAALTRQLLAYSGKQLVAPRLVDVRERIEHLGRMLPGILGSAIRLDVRQDGDPGAVKVDPGLIDQVIVNLAANARDAMPSGGSFAVETATARIGAADPPPRPDVAPGDYVVLTVQDTGTGMPPEVMARLFEPFFSTKPRGRGTGLGLAAAYGGVRQSGGDILVESTAGEGTTFRIYLPKAGDLERPNPAGSTAPPS